MDAGLAAFVRGASLDAKTRARLEEAVPEEFFTYPGGLTAREHQALTYDRLRRSRSRRAPGRGAAGRPAALCALLDRAAIADPALFHVMLLHYTLALGPILRFLSARTAPARTVPGGARVAGVDGLGGVLLMTEVGRSNSHLSPRTIASHDPPPASSS